MEVILIENIEKLGKIGDVVRVKDGYARNYLLPRKNLKVIKTGIVYMMMYQKNMQVWKLELNYQNVVINPCHI